MGKEVQKGFNWLKVSAGAFAHMVHDTFGAFLAPLMPLLKEKLGFGNTIAGLLFTSQRLPSLLSPFIGLIADRSGLKWMVIILPSITAICMSLLGIAPNLFILFTFLIVAGISSAVFHIPSPVMIRNASGNRIGKGMSLYMVGGESGRFIGPLLISAAVSLYTLDGSWVVMIFGFVSSLFLFIIFRDHTTPKTINLKSGYALEQLKKYSRFFGIMAVFLFFFGMMKSMLTQYLPIFIVESGGTFTRGAFLLALLQLAGIPGTMLSGLISDILGRKKTLIIIAVATPLFFLLYVLSSGWLSIVCLLLLGFFVIAPTPVLLSMVQDLPSKKPAFINSIFMGINFLFTSLALLLMGILSDIIEMEIIYRYVPLTGILALGTVLLIKKRKQI